MMVSQFPVSGMAEESVKALEHITDMDILQIVQTMTYQTKQQQYRRRLMVMFHCPCLVCPYWTR